MPAVFLMLIIFSELSLSIKAVALPALDNRTVEWYNREDHDSVSKNGTKDDELIGSSRAINLNLNKTKTDSLPSSTATSTIRSSDIGDVSNKTQKSNTFVVSRLLEYSAFSWLKNEYVMSIVIPIAAGIGSGLVLIILINICRCARAKCQRPCHKRNRNLPKHIKQMKLADRMKLLAESSDEEF